MARSRREIQNTEEKEKSVNPQQGSGVRCLNCGSRTHVLNSVPKPDINGQGRYRECDSCKTRYYTEERIVRFTQDKYGKVAQEGKDETENTDS